MNSDRWLSILALAGVGFFYTVLYIFVSEALK